MSKQKLGMMCLVTRPITNLMDTWAGGKTMASSPRGPGGLLLKYWLHRFVNLSLHKDASDERLPTAKAMRSHKN